MFEVVVMLLFNKNNQYESIGTVRPTCNFEFINVLVMQAGERYREEAQTKVQEWHNRTHKSENKTG